MLDIDLDYTDGNEGDEKWSDSDWLKNVRKREMPWMTLRTLAWATGRIEFYSTEMGSLEEDWIWENFLQLFPLSVFLQPCFFLVFVEYTRHALTSHFLFLWLEGSCLRYPLGSFSQFNQNSVQMSLSQRDHPDHARNHITPTFTTTFYLHSRHFFLLPLKNICRMFLSMYNSYILLSII